MMHHRPYTLIEVLAAVAVLVLMMSFLFQFTSGAQRIWSASNTQTTITDNADAIFALLNEDLSQMQVDSDLGMGYSIAASGDFAFYTLSTHSMGDGQTAAKVGSLLYVKYDYDATAKKLYRFQANAENGMYDASANLTPIGTVIDFSSISDDEKKKCLVAEGVEAFEVKVKASDLASTDELPGFIRVDIKLDNPNKTDEDGNSVEKFSVAKSYSQVFFIGMR